MGGRALQLQVGTDHLAAALPLALRHEALRDNFTIYGSPETVTEKILALRDEIGHFGTLMLTAQDWTDRERMTRSMSLLAEEVMPRVNAALHRGAA